MYEEINCLKDVLKKNSFPAALIDERIKIFLNEQFVSTYKHTVSKNELCITKRITRSLYMLLEKTK